MKEGKDRLKTEENDAERKNKIQKMKNIKGKIRTKNRRSLTEEKIKEVSPVL